MSTASHPPLIVVVGQTATGKTGLAVRLAQLLDGEVIGADSRQLYAGMAIGTAQPSEAERAGIPHHLIGCCDPAASLGLAQYLDRCREAIDAVRAQGRQPILAGGTGQYVRAVLEGWTVPRVPPDTRLRARFEAFAATRGATALHSRLAAVDSAAAASIHPNNVRRVARALEVYELTGQPISKLQTRQPVEAPRVVGLAVPREELYARIDARVVEMLSQGLVEEVESLRSQGYRRDLPSMQSIGYPEVWALIEGEITLDEAKVRVQHATHRLARQQQTWFRADDSRIQWLRPEQASADELLQTLQPDAFNEQSD